MAVQFTENASAIGFWLINQNGNKTYSTANQIAVSSTYTFSDIDQFGTITGNSVYPHTYNYVKLDFSKHNSAYSKNCFVSKVTGSQRVYLRQVSGGKKSSNSYYGAVADLKCLDNDDNVQSGLAIEQRTNGYINDTTVPYLAYVLNPDGVFGVIARVDSGPGYLTSDFVNAFTGWTGTFNAVFDGINSGNPPYESVTWERCDPEVIYEEIIPGNGAFIDEKKETRISVPFTIKTSESGIEYPPTDIILIWGTSYNDMSNEIVGDADTRSITIPANTFPDKSNIYCRIKYKSAAADEYFTTDNILYVTSDLIGSAGKLLPNGASLDGEIEHEFSWEYVNDSGLGQTAFDLQVSNDNGITWIDVFIHTESEVCKTIIPANTLLSGNTIWRVRVYNTDDTPSEWSEPAYLVVVAPPKPPVIASINNAPRISLSWSARDQQAYQIITNDYDSGVVFGTAKSAVIPVYYREGESVSVSIRIKNRFGEWSDKTTITVQVSNVSPGTITMTASAENAGIVLSWQAEGTFAKYYLLRDGEPIARTEETGYTDYFTAGESRYQVMGVDADGYYALSEEITLAPVLENGVISGVEPVDWIPLAVKRGNQPEFVSSHTESITYQYYSGRMLPVPYSSRFREVTRTLDFTVKLPAYRRLKELVGEIVIYKDYTGEKMIGVLNDLQTSGRPDRPDISASITAVDYSEVISLD